MIKALMDVNRQFITPLNFPTLSNGSVVSCNFMIYCPLDVLEDGGVSVPPAQSASTAACRDFTLCKSVARKGFWQWRTPNENQSQQIGWLSMQPKRPMGVRTYIK